MIKVVIADDHPLMLEGIKKVLSREIDIEIAGETNESEKVMDLLKEIHPNILILDFTMPGKSGLDLIKYIKRLLPNLPILILSIHPPERFAVRCIKSGSDGYLSKSTISDELVKAVRKIVTEKRKYISSDVAEEIASQLIESERPMHETLSDRELEILCFIAEGKEVNEIANKLSLSPHTVHTYRSRIKDKLKLSSNVEMTRYALINKLTT